MRHLHIRRWAGAIWALMAAATYSWGADHRPVFGLAMPTNPQGDGVSISG